ncbi:glycoside hydrolase family 2 TIM barrel-domain containing protein [Curtobacterium sp. MCJR17_043]|uniref:glycoside hydrolase family 2 TIM barrel-domain containing protein n=1 Tax=Curtobacterium sp. MCJR17_043 TaxID=2175660 RepID=UPI0024E03093|nr:glycoside hydrolase family 2 TIM barrel-domain containing protein [Curtobacterium sp. MCJR17_043]WIB37128.1 glycoside hydrolase family 2 TIM barrel-domain containing protein [Curtobacterium sp. MCJR17_043]
MDETFDMWTEGKSTFDYALAFPEWWERDVEALVAKDHNHPSVVFYSIGNEILETGDPPGIRVGPQTRGEGPVPRPHPVRHERDQRFRLGAARRRPDDAGPRWRPGRRSRRRCQRPDELRGRLHEPGERVPARHVEDGGVILRPRRSRAELRRRALRRRQGPVPGPGDRGQ